MKPIHQTVHTNRGSGFASGSRLPLRPAAASRRMAARESKLAAVEIASRRGHAGTASRHESAGRREKSRGGASAIRANDAATTIAPPAT